MSEASGWAPKSGWDEVDEAEKAGNSGGGGGSFTKLTTPVGATRRVLIIHDEPMPWYEHSTYGMTGVPPFFNPVCLGKNNLHHLGACPFCELSNLHDQKKKAGVDEKLLPPNTYATFAGSVTVIDLGLLQPNGTLMGYQGKNEEYIFQRKELRMKKGSAKKPGPLHIFRLARDKREGTLLGFVMDLQRTGAQDSSFGSHWDFLQRVDVSSVEAAKKSIRGIPGYVPQRHDQLLEKNVTTLDPIDYIGLNQPRSRGELIAMCGLNRWLGDHPTSGTDTSGTDTSGTEDLSSEDIPF